MRVQTHEAVRPAARGQVSIATVASLVLFALMAGRVMVFGARGTDFLVTRIPDDSLYYLVLAKNFAASGRWTFDGVAPSTGFHLIHAYALVLFYWVAPGAGLPTTFVVASLTLAAVLALAARILLAQPVMRTAAWHGPLVVCCMMAGFAMLSTNLMESAWVVLAGSLVAHCVFGRHDATPSRHSVAAAFLVGAFGSLCRSDFGLLPLGLACGATWVVSGHWLQGSVMVKRHWASLHGYSPVEFVANAFFLFAPWLPGTQATVAISVIVLVGGLALVLVAFAGGPWRRIAAPLAVSVLAIALYVLGVGIDTVAVSKLFIVGFVALVVLGAAREHRHILSGPLVGSLLSVALYVAFYGLDSVAVQPWYSASITVPVFLVIATLARGLAGRMAVVAAVWGVALGLIGLADGLVPRYPWQGIMANEGRFLVRHPQDRPVGAWNAGLVSYFAGGGVINLDGLVNDDAQPYILSDRLIDYIKDRNIRWVVDTDRMLGGDFARRGGYSDGTLAAALVPRELFNLPANVGIFTLYEVRH